MCSLWEYEYFVPLDMHDVNGRCVAACCTVLQRVAVCCSVSQCVVVCCSVLQCVAVFDIARAHTMCSVWEYEYRVPQVDMHYGNGTCVAVCRRVLRCVTVCCSASQCVAVCCSV